ncbi:MAG: penicillin acylase family protein [Polyangiaceae bacterium]
MSARTALASLFGFLVAQPALGQSASPSTVVEIHRTADDIPHILGSGFRELGYGIGYAQAQDALCTLAEAFVTFEGRRAYFFGPKGHLEHGSVLGLVNNLDSDFFFRAFADDEVVAQYRTQSPPGLNQSIAGFVEGYNRYVRERRAARTKAPRGTCGGEPWLREIEPRDVYRRLYAVQVAAGYERFIAGIVNAKPPSALPAPAATTRTSSATSAFSVRVGQQAGTGSNMMAFGRQATGEQSVLFGNPHWYWGGWDRFYQMHLSIPGRLQVAGVSFLGVPLIILGFNEHVAWSHTVSEARRFGLFEIVLDPKNPTQYLVDGKPEAMQRRQVRVELRAAHGGTEQLVRTLYSTRFGPVVDLGEQAPALAWSAERALSIRDVNAPNFRIFRNFFFWDQARSLEEFVQIQRRETSMAWVNTAAIGHNDARVWYGDVGAVPNVPDSLRAACATPLARAFAALDPNTPLLDGSRSACNWLVEPSAAQPGALPAAELPSMFREDYVANMNDSYWLSNARRPLEGFSAVLGGERQPLSLRGRLGHRMALDLLAAGKISSQALSQRLMRDVLSSRVYSAELFKSELLAAACARGGASVARACEVLRRWPNTGNAGDRGALLWDAFWAELDGIAGERFRVPFSPQSPLDTPRGPQADDVRVVEALRAAVAQFEARGWALDMPLGAARFVRAQGQHVPLYGGCPSAGYFTVACNEDDSYELGPHSLANSYLQVVRFTANGVEAHTLLAHGEREFSADDGYAPESVARYASKRWLRFPFTEAEIARDAALRTTVLHR